MFNKQVIVEKNKKTKDYVFKLDDSNLNEFYEELFKYLFEDNNTKRLDDFLQISENRLEEYIQQNYYYET